MPDKRTSEEWVVVWFPPEADRTRTFKSEDSARTFAAKDDVAAWNPLLEWRSVTTITESRLLDLGGASG